jgi:hypothetical protein
MKRPKGKLLALLAVFAALGIATATGAFTTVTAERTATVAVSGDSSAELGLSPNSEYASLNNGELEINFNPTDNQGVNINAATTVTDVFTITNNGDTPVTISLSSSGDNAGAIDFAVASDGFLTTSGNAPSQDDVGIASGTQLSLQSDSVRIGAGDSISVGMYIDTSDSDPSDGLNYDSDPVEDGEEIIGSLTISAESNTAATYLYDEDDDGTPDVSNP